MYSSDKNTENIASLVEELKKHLSLRLEHTKFDVIDKVVRIITVLSLTIIIMFLIILMLIYLSFAASYVIGDMTGSMPIGFLCVASFYLLVLLIVTLRRKSWIERPLVKFLTSILFD